MKTQQKCVTTVMTTLGQIMYSRYSLIPSNSESKDILYKLRGVKSIFPIDSYLGLSGLPFKITPAAMLKIAYWAQNQSSYQRAEDAIADAMHIKVNDDTIRQVTNYVGSLVFQNDCKKAEEAFYILENREFESKKKKQHILYIQTDGATLNTRLKNAEGSTWRENKLGKVFSTDNIYYWTNHKGIRQHMIGKKEYISYVGTASEFKKHLLACALRNGYGCYRDTVVLSDGATWIRNIVEECFPDAQHILDFFHLCENVHTYAKYLFKMDETKYKPWAKDICELLKNSQYDIVLQKLYPYKDKKPNECPVNLYGYILNNINNIDYASYEQKGYFIGSGAIESGNKIILQDRLKRAGMRWNTQTAQAMLTLKTKAESGLWHCDVEIPFLQHCFSQSLNF